MIDISSELLNSYEASPQFGNMWEFYMEDWNTSQFNISKLKVISTNLPFLQLENATHITGHKYYSGYKLPETFSITFREDSDFSVTNYFKTWEREIFDVVRGCFISSETDKIRNGVFVYSKFYSTATSSDLFEIGAIETLRGVGNSIVSTASKNKVVSTVASGSINLGTSLITGMSKFFKEIPTQTYYFKGIRYLGIAEQSGSYDSPEELKITVNFAVDTILDSQSLQSAKQRILAKGNSQNYKNYAAR